MIRRDAADSWLLIRQPEHARFAGALAARWAAEPVIPRDAVVFAIAHHDDGWIDWERAPRADPQTGFPVDFQGVRFEEFADIWRRGPRLAAAHDAYAGLLVSRHGSALAEMARGRRPGEAAAFDELLREQEEFRRGLAEAVDVRGERLERNVRLLQALDFLSLTLCMGPAEEPERTPPRSGSAYAGPRSHVLRSSTIGPMRLTPRGERAVAVAPWPFDRTEVRAEVEAFRLPKARYDDEGLARALERAPRLLLDFELTREE